MKMATQEQLSSINNYMGGTIELNLSMEGRSEDQKIVDEVKKFLFDTLKPNVEDNSDLIYLHSDIALLLFRFLTEANMKEELGEEAAICTNLILTRLSVETLQEIRKISMKDKSAGHPIQ